MPAAPGKDRPRALRCCSRSTCAVGPPRRGGSGAGDCRAWSVSRDARNTFYDPDAEHRLRQRRRGSVDGLASRNRSLDERLLDVAQVLHRQLLEIVRHDEVCRRADDNAWRRTGGRTDLSRDGPLVSVRALSSSGTSCSTSISGEIPFAWIERPDGVK
jgi:hypothetical protein